MRQTAASQLEIVEQIHADSLQSADLRFAIGRRARNYPSSKCSFEVACASTTWFFTINITSWRLMQIWNVLAVWFPSLKEALPLTRHGYKMTWSLCGELNCGQKLLNTLFAKIL